MKYLFWNTAKNTNINDILQLLIMELDCDVISLAEYESNTNDLLRNLSKCGYDYYQVPKIGCKRIDIITKFKPGKISHLNETSYYTVKKIPHESLGFHLVAFVHFPSKLYMTEFDYMEEARLFKMDIENAEQVNKNNKTVIVGDFNMNPFEDAMVASTAIHSVPSRNIAHQITRKIKDREYTMFYNPMWNLLGDKDDPPGTYYYRSAEHRCFFWNIFDQVIIRPSLIKNFDPCSVKIVKSIIDFSLVDKNGYPCKDISDHLPLYFEIR